MHKNKSLSLRYKLLLLSYITVLCTCWFCVYQALRGSMDNKMNAIFENAADEQFRAGNSIKTMIEGKQYSPENRKYYLLGAIKNGMDAYAKYYSGHDSFFQISTDRGESVYSDFPSGWREEMPLSPGRNGSVNYCLQSLEGKKVVFVSSYVKIYTELFRFDYARDVTQSLGEEMALTARMAWIVFFALVFLALLIYFGIRNALKPLDQLAEQARAIANGIYGMRVKVYHDDEVGGVASEFNQMADAVEAHINMVTEAARLRELFAANLAHEIKTPITSIVGYADYSARKELNRDELYHIQSYIKQEGKRLDSLSHKLLEWSDISRRQEADCRPCDAHRLIRHILSTATAFTQEKEQKISIENTVDMIFADEVLFVSLLTNLLSNASKASDNKAAIELTMELQDTPEKRLLVRVIDHGAGIRDEDLRRITEPFYMADKARDRRNGGSGLGLALCSAIVKAHHGEMRIQSEESIGTTVSVIIPQPDHFDNLFTFV